jgi:hypothetical protein
METNDFSTYPNLSTHELLTRLSIVTQHLVSSHGELSIVLTEEHKAKLAGFFSSEATSTSGREWDAKKAAETASIARFELEADIAEFTEEKYLILRILDEKKKMRGSQEQEQGT